MKSIKGGYTNYGQDIGILMMRTVFPRLIGDIGNARTFPFPVRYHIVDIDPLNMTEKNAHERLIQPFIQAAQELEAEGCKAITTSCSFLSGFQRQLSSAVNIPVFTSTLILVPMIHTMLGPKKSIGILTECADMVSEPFFQQAGWSSRDIPVHVTGMVPDSVFSKLIIGDNPDGDWEQIELCVQEMVQRHMASYPDTVLCFWNVLILPLLQKRFKTSPQFPYLELISCCNIWIHVSMLPIIALCNRHLFSKNSVPIRNYEQLQ